MLFKKVYNKQNARQFRNKLSGVFGLLSNGMGDEPGS